MKLRTFRVLCFLCILCTFALSEEIDRENRPALDSDFQESEELTANNPRDKRALGLILSGLAQVFGYAMDPIQIASLPNSDSNEARATNQTSANNQTASTPAASTNMTQAGGSSTTAAPAVPGQRETIRFTGVVNFGNSTNLLTHLQQYETLFHGNSSSTTASPSSTSPPQMNTRAPMSNQSATPPFLVRIPIPSVSQPPLPRMPQPPLPEIPPQDIMLSYPRPLIPIQLPAISTQAPPVTNNQSTTMMTTQRPVVMRQNVTVRLTVQSKEINNPKDIQKPLPPTFSPSIEERWKEEYENRLAELERKQEEHARKLMEQELYRNQQQQDDYSSEEDEKVYPNRKPVTKCEEENASQEEENDSREKDEFSKSKIMRESEEVEEEEQGKYYDKDADKANQYEDAPQISENYTSVQYSEPLPLSEDDERRPDELRNSYGEPLYNSKLFDDGFVNYFEKFGKPLTDFYSSPESPKEEESSEDSREENERNREEEDVPARNRYEEYNLEGDGDTNKKDEAESSEDSSEQLVGKNGNVLTKGENKSYFNEEKVIEEMDFSKYMPLIVPVRYLSAPEELKKLKPRIEKSEKDNSAAKTESLKKVSSKSRKPKKENSRPAASFPQRRTPKKLHEEGEEKGAQVWPPPFDFVVDSTIHANVLPKTSDSSSSIKISDARRKSQVPKKKKGKRQQQQRRGVTIDNTTREPYENPEDIYYQDIKKVPQYGTIPEEQLLLNGPENSARLDDAHFEIVETKSDQSHATEVPDLGQRYRYTLNNNYRNLEQPNVHLEENPLYANRFESLKRSIENPVFSTENYYSKIIYPAENKEQINLKNSGVQNIELVPKKYEQTTIYPRGNRNFFNTGKSVYDFDRGTGNERMFGVFGGDKKIANKASIGLTIPQPDVYVESLTKFASEPESKNEKVRATDYTNSATTMRVMEQERINPSEPISYIDYPRIL